MEWDGRGYLAVSVWLPTYPAAFDDFGGSQPGEPDISGAMSMQGGICSASRSRLVAL
jgi:hypothetical protein